MILSIYNDIEIPEGHLDKITQVLDDGSERILWARGITVDYLRDYDWQTCKRENIYFGSDGEPPTMESPIELNNKSYFFKGWNIGCKKVSEDISAFGLYDTKFTVTYKKDYDGSVFNTQTYTRLPVMYPRFPANSDYNITAWNPQQSQISKKEDTTVIAMYGDDRDIIIDKVQDTFHYNGQDANTYIVEAHVGRNFSNKPTIYYKYEEEGEEKYTITPKTTSDSNFNRVVNVKLVSGSRIIYHTSSFRVSSTKEVKRITFNRKLYFGCNSELFESPYICYAFKNDSAIPPENYDRFPYAYKFKSWNKDYSSVTEDMTINAVYEKRKISYRVHSSNSRTSKNYTSYYGEPINPNAICDSTPYNRYTFIRWYTLKNGEKITINRNELDSFKYDNIDIYPEFVRRYYVDIYVDDGQVRKIFTYNVLHGENILTSEIPLPSDPKYRLINFNPEANTWNPITADTSITAYYKQIFDVDIYTKHSTKQKIHTYNIVSGDSLYAKDIELPEYDGYFFDKFDPLANTWNPINSNTSITAIYQMAKYLIYEDNTEDKTKRPITSTQMYTEDDEVILYDGTHKKLGLIFKTSDGKEFRFAEESLPTQGLLQYRSSNSPHNVIEPYSLCAELNDANNLIKVNDQRKIITSIGDYSFTNCSNLSSINCNNVKTIGSWAFNGCSNISSLILSEVTDIEKRAFNDCFNLSSIYCPNLKNIGIEAFSGCYMYLTSFICPKLNSLLSKAFENDSNITYLDFRDATIDIFNLNSLYTGYYENNINTIILSNMTNVPSLEARAFGFMSQQQPKHVDVYIPFGKTQEFINNGWKRTNISLIECSEH